jgi:hypothetical protein
MMRRIAFRTGLGLAAAAALGLAGCAHSKGSSSGSSQAAAEAPKKAEKEKPAKGVPPPPGSRLAKVQLGMDDSQVRQIMGEPTGMNSYVTGKAFIPYYYGTDTSRMDWKYKGEGRVVFSRNAYSGHLKVVRVDYDPHETGQ